MPENPTPTTADPSAATKRYTPPNQRNRSLNRRKSGDRLDRTNNSYGNVGEKNQPPVSRNVPIADHGDAGSATFLNEKNSRPRIIALEGCSRSEAYQLLNGRWAAAMHLYNDPTIDLSERPTMYSGSNVWGRLPHQMMSSANNIGASSVGLQMNFLSELRRAMQNTKSSSNN